MIKKALGAFIRRTIFLCLLLPPLYTKAEDYRATGVVVISCMSVATGLYLAFAKKERKTEDSVCGLGLIFLGFVGTFDSTKIVDGWDKMFGKPKGPFGL